MHDEIDTRDIKIFVPVLIQIRHKWIEFIAGKVRFFFNVQLPTAAVFKTRVHETVKCFGRTSTRGCALSIEIISVVVETSEVMKRFCRMRATPDKERFSFDRIEFGVARASRGAR